MTPQRGRHAVAWINALPQNSRQSNSRRAPCVRTWRAMSYRDACHASSKPHSQELYAVGAMRRHPRSGVCNAGCANLDICALVRRAFVAQTSSGIARRAPWLPARRSDPRADVLMVLHVRARRSASTSLQRCTAWPQRSSLALRAPVHSAFAAQGTNGMSQRACWPPAYPYTPQARIPRQVSLIPRTAVPTRHAPLPERIAAAPPACLFRGPTDSRLRHFARDRLSRRCAPPEDMSVVDYVRAQRAIPGPSTVSHTSDLPPGDSLCREALDEAARAMHST
ncbi:hypothetical protein FB451DRAFT_1554185 [Mycena latifolia]|nr:hypothetical protein FB451DRAFT_1554185 [Mycena latifolia]